MNWVFATNSNVRIPLSLEPAISNLIYIDLTELIVWNIYGLRYWISIAKIKGLENNPEFVKKIQFLFCKQRKMFKNNCEWC